jgi:hypothetical protein
LVSAAPGRLVAQWQATADAGIARLRQTGIPESNASTFGGTAEVFGDRAWVRSSLLAARASDRWTGQGVVVGSLFGPAERRARWELSGSASAFGETNASGATSAELMGRIHVGPRAFGGAFGVGAGGTSDRGDTHSFAHAQADAWKIVGADRFIGDASFVSTRRSDTANAPMVRVSYADLSGNWRRESGAVSLGAVLGVRAGMGSIDGGNGWGSVDVTTWVAPNLAFVATAGRSLDDVIRGVPRTQYVSIAIRVAAHPHASLRSPTAAKGPTVVASRDRIELRVDRASTVEVMGDFTDWLPVSLTREGTVWRLDRSLTPGLHRIALRIDGGEWTTPANLPRATDDLGGSVGLMTVP